MSQRRYKTNEFTMETLGYPSRERTWKVNKNIKPKTIEELIGIEKKGERYNERTQIRKTIK